VSPGSTKFPRSTAPSTTRVFCIYQLKLWRETEPDAPEGLWYKDFGSFKICGEKKYPKIFLRSGQSVKGTKL